MHEYSIVQALVERVTSEAVGRGASAVHRVSVRIGELSGVEIELFRSAYETFRGGTICDDADLDVQAVPALWTCRRCGGAIPRGGVLRCPHCELPATLVQGDEIMLDRIEMEVP